MTGNRVDLNTFEYRACNDGKELDASEFRVSFDGNYHFSIWPDDDESLEDEIGFLKASLLLHPQQALFLAKSLLAFVESMNELPASYKYIGADGNPRIFREY